MDRQRLEPILTGETPPTKDRFDIGVDYGTAEKVRNESVFVPKLQYDIDIRGGNRYRIGIDSRTAPEAEYRYEVTEITPAVDTFAE